MASNLSMSTIMTVYGQGRPVYNSLADYYNSGPNVKACVQNTPIPKSGVISFSNFLAPLSNAEVIFDTPGTYTFQVPPSVSNVSMVCVGGGGGGGCGGSNAGTAYGSGGGGALMYRNNYAVTPNQPLTVTVGAGGTGGNMTNRVGANGGDSFVMTSGGTIICQAKGGTGGGTTAGIGGQYSAGVGDGGGSGGNGAVNATFATGGGGAGGYRGPGAHYIFTTSNNVSSMYGIQCTTGGGSSGGALPNGTMGGGGGGVDVYGAPHSYDDIMTGIVGHVPFDSNAIDIRANYTLTPTNVTYSTTGRGVALTNGFITIANSTPYSTTALSANAYATTGSAPVLTIANGVTISLWLRLDTLPGSTGEGSIYTFFNGSTATLALRVRTSTYTIPSCISFGYMNSSSTLVFIDHSAITTSQWTHVVGTLTSTTVALFVNGFRFTAPTTSMTMTTLQQFILGCNNDQTLGMNGAVNDLMIWNRLLSHQEISYLFQVKIFGSYLPLMPRLNNMVGHMTFDNEIIDKVGNYVFSNTGATFNTSVNLFGTACIRFANATPGGTPSAYLLSTSSPTIQVATTGISVSLWVHPTALPTGSVGSRVVAFVSGSAELFAIHVGNAIETPVNAFALVIGNGTNSTGLLSATSATANRWTHLAGSFDPITMKLIMYVNGVKYVSSVIPTNILTFSTLSAVNIGASTSTTRAYSGYVDDLRIFNRVLGDSEVQHLLQYRGTGQRSIRYNATAYFDFDSSTVTDAFGNYTMTNTGCTFSSTDLVQKSYNSRSLVITNTISDTNNTATQYVTASSPPTLPITEGLTIALWFKASAIPTGAGSSFLVSYYSSVPQTIVGLYVTATNIVFQCRSTTTNITTLTGPTYSQGIWQHVTCVYDPSASQLRMYVNGKRTIVVDGFVTTYTSVTSLHLGADHSLARGFNGLLGDVKIWDIALNDSDIMATYLANNPFTNGGSTGLLSGLVGSMKFDGDLVDETDQYSFTNTGGTFSTSDKIFGTASLQLSNTVASSSANSVTQYIRSTRNYPIFLASGATISFWVKATSLASTGFVSLCISSTDASGTLYPFELGFHTASRNYALYLAVQETSTTLTAVISSRPSVANTWYHVVGVADPLNMVLKIFVNGERFTIGYNPVFFPVVGTMLIGGSSSNFSRGFAGRIDHLNIWNRPLRDEECMYLYTSRIFGFGGSRAPEAGLHGAISSQSFLCYIPFDNDSIDQENTYTSSVFGQVYFTSSTSAVGYSINLTNATPGSATVQATSYVLATSTTSAFALPITVCLWVYFTGSLSTSSRITIYSTPTLSLYHDPTNGLLAEMVSGTTVTTPTFTGSVLSASTWYHVVVIVTTTAITLFLNGNQVAAATIPFSSSISMTPLYFGCISTLFRAFQGNLDDFKILSTALSADNVYRMYNRLDGGAYGGGGGAVNTLLSYQAAGNGGNGAVRLTWNNSTSRMFPSRDVITAYKPTGGRFFLSTGILYWVVPENVSFVTIICVGGGGGGNAGAGTNAAGGSGGGGALAYTNNVSVTPGEVIIVTVGDGGAGGTRTVNPTSGSTSSVERENGTVLCSAGGGAAGGATVGGAGGTVIVGDGGGAGGAGNRSTTVGAGGGGAGGYTGSGGTGSITATGNAGSGGGGGSGGSTSGIAGSGGGGVSIYGSGSNGSGGTSGGGGGGGSGGAAGTTATTTDAAGAGGLYGGGGGANNHTATAAATGGSGGQGVVRIIWSDRRSFPSTLVSTNEVPF